MEMTDYEVFKQLGLKKVDYLIELVEERPAIWDKTAVGYRNRDICVRAWEEINRLMLDTYDSFNEDTQKRIGNYIKQKWTTARDKWQRSHRKLKEAIQTGGKVNGLKDYIHYEKLKFLAKVYDNEYKDKKMCKSNQVNFGCPPSSQNALKEEDFPKLSTNFDHNLMSVGMKQGLQQQDIKILSNKRKLDHSSVDVIEKTNQGASFHKPVIVNVGDGVKIASLISASKPSTSVDGKEAYKSSFKAQTSKREQMYNSARLEERATSTNHLTKNSSNQTPKKLKLEAPDKSVIPDNLTQPGVSNMKKRKHEAIEERENKKKVIDMRGDNFKVEPTSSILVSQHKSLNTKLGNVFQNIRDHTTEFSKEQIMGLFFEILIKRIDKKEIMDTFFEILKRFIPENETLEFGIEALQLIKKQTG